MYSSIRSLNVFTAGSHAYLGLALSIARLGQGSRLPRSLDATPLCSVRAVWSAAYRLIDDNLRLARGEKTGRVDRERACIRSCPLWSAKGSSDCPRSMSSWSASPRHRNLRCFTPTILPGSLLPLCIALEHALIRPDDCGAAMISPFQPKRWGRVGLLVLRT
jgi:hypothetical protein